MRCRLLIFEYVVVRDSIQGIAFGLLSVGQDARQCVKGSMLIIRRKFETGLSPNCDGCSYVLRLIPVANVGHDTADCECEGDRFELRIRKMANSSSYEREKKL